MSKENMIANWAATYLTYLVTFFLYNDFFVGGGDGSSIIFFFPKALSVLWTRRIGCKN